MRALLTSAALAAGLTLAGQAHAALICGSTITVANGGSLLASNLGAGVCVAAADKTFGNFVNLGGAGVQNVAFNWSAPVGGTHTLAFSDSFTGPADGTTAINIG